VVDGAPYHSYRQGIRKFQIVRVLQVSSAAPKSILRLLMATTVLIGVEPHELHWLRVLVALLRHPDPSVPELARQALLYLSEAAGKRSLPPLNTLDHTG
jgi:hypothetical protein